jgi:predicted heme/steroid binding protein
MGQKSFTRKQLSRFDGRDGRPAYIAFKGNVYDVNGSFLWMGGRHQALHNAGEKLTNVLDRAPHGEDLLDRVPLIGTLIPWSISPICKYSFPFCPHPLQYR